MVNPALSGESEPEQRDAAESEAWAHKPAELRSAFRRARIAEAERSGAIYDLRMADIARLELLDEALQPLFAALPADVEMFETGIIASERPQLFLDAAAFVELARDHRTYRLCLDTLEGRIVLGESTEIEAIKRHVSDHIARRMLARERALASTAYPPGMLNAPGTGAAVRSDPITDALGPSQGGGAKSRGTGRGGRMLATLLMFLLGAGFGALTLAAWLIARGKL